MFPLRDDNPTTTPAIVTWVIVGVNLAVWIFVQGAGMGDAVAASVCNYGLIPGELLLRVKPGSGFDMGNGMACVMDAGRAPLHLLYSMFLHGSWGHILGNLWFLYIFGNNVEEAFGHLRYALFYLASGLAAAALQVFAEPGSMIPMVGASGAISGVLGAYLVLYPRARVHNLVFLGFYITTIRLPAWLMLGYWIALQLFGGVMARSGEGGTAFWAHVGGFVVGILMGFVLAMPIKRAQRWAPPPEFG
ncbi:MAG TPA: rhomboid family intramembrane serine protease [Gemmatimonadales bacterium]|nr:rhomboid family intramembrane serine protease [Gemmatimonadales bacterium]